jgi:hypothetical protein
VPRGGKRNGAGRKRGSATEKTREIADRIAAEGVTPLQVMIEAMNNHRAAGHLDRAAAIAKDAAPYMHPRLSYVKSDVSFPDDADDAALDQHLQQLAARQTMASGEAQGDQGQPGKSTGNGRVES